MFYSHNILQKRGGRFGKIWIAATRSSTLTKREYVTINIVNTCKDIVNCILMQAEPRLSLYLSSQLMCGVVRVYKKQCEYLANEVINFHSRLSAGRLNITVGIDLPISRDKHTLPEISMLNPEFEAQLAPALPSYMIPEEDMFSSSSTFMIDSSRHQSPRKRLKMDAAPHLALSPEAIKLKETQTPSIQNIQIPGGEIDLASFDPGFEKALAQVQAAMDSLHAPPMVIEELTSIPEAKNQVEGLLLIEEETGQLVLSPNHERKSRKDRKRKHDAEERVSPESQLLPPPEVLLSPQFPTIEELTAPSNIDIHLPDFIKSHESLAPKIPTTEELTVSSDEITATQDLLLSPKFPTIDELTMPIVDVALHDDTIPPQEVTPQADKITIPTLELSPVTESPRGPRRGKKRCLQFSDKDIQLQKEVMRQNMATSDKLCKPSDIMPLQLYPSTAELFKLPTRKGTRKSKQLMDVWRQHAIPIDYQSPHDGDIQIWSINYLQDAPTDEDILDVNREISAVEGMRDASIDSVSKRATPASLLLTDSTRLSETTRESILVNPDNSTTLGRRLTTESIDEVPIELEMLHQLAEFDPIQEEGKEVPKEFTVRAPVEGVVTLDVLHEDKDEKSITESLTVSQETVLREISKLTTEGSMSFHELCPPGSYKQVVVKVFTVCIQLYMLGIIKMSQSKFYGRIMIERGARF